MTFRAALFDLAQRPPAPTALGLRVYEHALPILRAVDGCDGIWAPALAAPKTTTS
jgi:DNA-binding transcriptional LysR family regulator